MFPSGTPSREHSHIRWTSCECPLENTGEKGAGSVHTDQNTPGLVWSNLLKSESNLNSSLDSLYLELLLSLKVPDEDNHIGKFHAFTTNGNSSQGTLSPSGDCLVSLCFKFKDIYLDKIKYGKKPKWFLRNTWFLS